MKLRVRFTVGFALAALVPIAVAAIVTRQIVSRSLRKEYVAARAAAEHTVRRQLSQLEAQVVDAVGALTSRDHPWVGGAILRDIVTNAGQVRQALLTQLRTEGPEFARSLGLEVFIVTYSDEVIAAHSRSLTQVRDVTPARRAAALPGKPIFARELLLSGPVKESALVAEAADVARDGRYEVAVLVGHRVGPDLFAGVRLPGRVDARIVDPNGLLLLPPASADWAQLASDPPIRIPLVGPDGAAVATVEIAVSDGGLDKVLLEVTLISIGLAVAAVGLMVLLGLIVARRVTRDLDELVAAAVAAARGDMEHRVPVRGEDEVAKVGHAFNLMMEDLRGAKDRLVIMERIAAWQEIARRLAHEIKNPLTPIQMAMDTLRKTWRKKHPSFDEILEESTATVLEEADRLKRIVTEFSDFARMPKPDFQKCDVNEAVSAALALYQGAAPVDRNLGGGLPEIEADKGQLQQLLLNLVENARDAIGQLPGGRIIVSTRRGDGGDRVAILVEDNGPGVPPELKDKVFQPYFTTKQARGGTGLGLAIVHRIVSDHGGRITLTEVARGGARFMIELPLRQGTPLLASRI